jgi:hypothetical protein
MNEFTPVPPASPPEESEELYPTKTVYSIQDIQNYLEVRKGNFGTAESQMILDLYRMWRDAKLQPSDQHVLEWTSAVTLAREQFNRLESAVDEVEGTLGSVSDALASVRATLGTVAPLVVKKKGEEHKADYLP